MRPFRLCAQIGSGEYGLQWIWRVWIWLCLIELGNDTRWPTHSERSYLTALLRSDNWTLV
jgi:hypothetical protein